MAASAAQRKSAPKSGGVAKRSGGPKAGTKSKKKASDTDARSYVVSSLEEWVPDGFHSYQGPGDRAVHGVYASLAAANRAARDVFFKKNPLGLDAEELKERRDIFEDERRGGMLHISVHPADSPRWEVRVERVAGS